MSTNLLVPLGKAVGLQGLLRRMAKVQPNDVLQLVGLTRRRSFLVENLALVGLGAMVGAGVALLLAPATGSATRDRFVSELDRVKHATTRALQEARAHAQVVAGDASERSKQDVASTYTA
jgi:hypothetical protein